MTQTIINTMDNVAARARLQPLLLAGLKIDVEDDGHYQVFDANDNDVTSDCLAVLYQSHPQWFVPNNDFTMFKLVSSAPTEALRQQFVEDCLRQAVGFPAVDPTVTEVTEPVNDELPELSASGLDVGDTVTCSNGSWTGEDSLSKQWYRDGVAIAGETGDSYDITIDDIDASITCRVTATNAYGSTVVETEPVSAEITPQNTVAPVISGGDLELGDTLTCTTGTWVGTAPITYAYQWYSDGLAVPDQTDSTYVVRAEDADEKEIYCKVTATNIHGSNTEDSNALTTPAVII